MIWLILYFIIAFVIFITLLCLCCIEYKKIDRYSNFQNWMRIHENWDIILYSTLWIVFLVEFIVLAIVFIPINLVLKCFDIEPIRIWLR